MIDFHRTTIFLRLPGASSMKYRADLQWPPVLGHTLTLPGVHGEYVDICECASPGDRSLSADIVDCYADETQSIEQRVLLLKELGWTIAGGPRLSKNTSPKRDERQSHEGPSHERSTNCRRQNAG